MDAQLLILDEIGLRLAGLKILNGYRFDVEKTSILRAKLTPFKFGDLPAVNYWPTTDTLSGKQNGMENRELNITIEGYSVTRDVPFTDLAVTLGNDIITALFRSVASPNVTDQLSTALGGLIEQLSIDSITPMIVEGQQSWVGVLVEITASYNITVGTFSAITKY